MATMLREGADLSALREEGIHLAQALEARTSHMVSALDEACSQRRWWVEQWPEGSAYVAGLIAQDVQDALVDGAALASTDPDRRRNTCRPPWRATTGGIRPFR